MEERTPPPSSSQQLHRFPTSKYVDSVNWISFQSFNRRLLLSLFDPDSCKSSIEVFEYDPRLHLSPSPLSLVHLPSRVSSLRTSISSQKALISASTSSGTLHLLTSNPTDASITHESSLPKTLLHNGPISSIDLHQSGAECLTVGEDGRINLVSMSNSKLDSNTFFDSKGITCYNSVKWASPAEFATGGLGFGVQWWDTRRAGGPVCHLRGDWMQRFGYGVVHSVDVHPSRKHICVAGGSSGAVFAWDLRFQKNPILLSGVGFCEEITTDASPVSESEVWQVRFDTYMDSKRGGLSSLSGLLPVVICSEDGILAGLEQGENHVDLLAEPCAINGFDIDVQNPQDVVCNLEWESVAVLSRP